MIEWGKSFISTAKWGVIYPHWLWCKCPWRRSSNCSWLFSGSPWCAALWGSGSENRKTIGFTLIDHFSRHTWTLWTLLWHVYYWGHWWTVCFVLQTHLGFVDSKHGLWIKHSINGTQSQFDFNSSLPTSTEPVSYLWLNAQQVFLLSGPKQELHAGAWVVSLVQHHTRVFLQDVPYLSRPLNYQSFDRV